MTTKQEILDILLGTKESVPAPIYLVSTHGVYDISEGPVDSFIVPPNTYIFEASAIGESTYDSIDEPLWELVQNRSEFVDYLNSSGKDLLKKQVFKNLIYYKPGDTLFKRILFLESSNEYNYRWGYYKFNISDPYEPLPKSPSIINDMPIIIPNEPSDPPYTTVMKSFRNEHFPPGKTRLRSFERIEDGSDIRFINETRKRDIYDGPAIFIFSSCASFWTSKHKQFSLNRELSKIQKYSEMEAVLEIGRAQQLANLNFAEMGFTSGHISGEDDIPNLLVVHSRNVRPRKTKQVSVKESFITGTKLSRNLTLTDITKDEKEYITMVGSIKNIETRYNPIKVPPGSASIFYKKGDDEYSIAISPTGSTWWTYSEIEDAIDNKKDIYTYINGSWIKLVSKRGIYTAVLRQRPNLTKKNSRKRNNTRKIL